MRELQIGRHCQSPNIVQYFGASQNDAKDIVLVMEYMDWGYVLQVMSTMLMVYVHILIIASFCWLQIV